ncbi:MAG: tryptophan halogenase family protein [Asticcacaulis sp.]|uniref:tryptophan halogenase family protein n=1 Tax=Asticcacaulis tiandongensis TaxID=2565365 RepID=UPI0011284B5E|nr:tryptophan halogenase family protein [Asticcacaulis tiandongensis]
MRENRIQSIIIIGGGTAGWMTAAALSKILGKDYADIRLVESEQIATVGVGEATIPQLNVFNRLLGLDENDFVRQTNGSFKLGIEFVDWARKGDRYFHPFGPYGVDMRGVSFHAYWQKLQTLGVVDSISDYNLMSVAARENRFMRADRSAKNSPIANISYAFHFDASLYAKFLRRFSEAHGVTRVEGKVVDVEQNPENGFVTAIKLENGERLEAELFIDCSGFRGVLIEQVLKTGYNDWSKYLPNNRAWATQCEYHRDENGKTVGFTPFTRATAREAGWQWRIPLQHRIGTGYVFSNNFVDEEKARDTLLQNLDGKYIQEPHLIKFVGGHRKKFWNKNVVAIGLAAGFMEPLESTSIFLIQSGIAKLLQLFPDKDFEPADRDRFNTLSTNEYEYIRDFLVLHFNATERDDTPYWDYCRNIPLPDRLKEKYEVFQSRGRIFREDLELFNDTSWFAVMTGQRMQSRSYDPVVEMLTDEELKARLHDIKDVIYRSSQVMPSQAEFIKRHCASPEFVHG